MKSCGFEDDLQANLTYFWVEGSGNQLSVKEQVMKSVLEGLGLPCVEAPGEAAAMCAALQVCACDCMDVHEIYTSTLLQDCFAVC